MGARRPRSTEPSRGKAKQAIAIATFVMLVAALPGGAAGASQDTSHKPKLGPGVLEAIERGDEPSVVVALAIGATRDLEELRREVTAAQDDALAQVSEKELEVRHRYATVPAFSGIARSEAAIHRLAEHPRVTRIDLDLGGMGSLTESVPVIRADLRHDRGNRGAGVVVAVLDTGIDSDHPDLADALVAEACFGDNDGSIDGSGFCPDGSDRQTGDGAAADDAGHGTHVSGIVASNGTVSGMGVAPDAGIVAIKVLDNCTFSGCFSAFSEIVAALDYIIDNPDLGVQVVNMSLGTGALYTGECDNASAGLTAGANAVNTLRANGVTLFASAGNGSSGTQMSAPACLSGVISVGATDNDDNVAGFSNSNAETDIFAPGVGIESLGIGGGLATASGTSMASPHAAGCAALLIETGDATTPAAIQTRLEASGVQVTDPKNGLTFPRIDCVPDDNEPPAVTADHPTVTVDEGSTATSSGTVSDPDGDAVDLSASVGTVVDNGDGTWSWSFATTDGPAESQTVTITATDALGAETLEDFDLDVENVAPIVDAGPDASILSNETFTFTGGFSDPGVIDFPWGWEIDWDDGTPTAGSTNNQATPIAASHEFCTAGDYTVTLSVTDGDGGTGSDSMQVTVGHVPVLIDVKPEDGSAPISLRSRGMIPVAVLSTSELDATSVDPATVTLGDGDGPGTPVAQRSNGTLFASVEDIDGNGMLDLVMQFRTQELVDNGDLSATTTTLHLEGVLQDGCTNVLGSEDVTVVP